jgi:hypothetical protein
MKDKPLCADCQISEVGPPVDESPPPVGHIRHTVISTYVLYKMAPAPPVNLWCACHHLQHVPIQNILDMVMFKVLETDIDYIWEG